jgi:hypothetical protein
LSKNSAGQKVAVIDISFRQVKISHSCYFSYKIENNTE